MFRTERQQCQAIRALLRPLNLDHLWTETGPTKKACDYVTVGSPLSSGENILLRAAFDLWNGAGKITLWEIQGSLDQGHCLRLFSLILAVGSGGAAVDKWLAANTVELTGVRP